MSSKVQEKKGPSQFHCSSCTQSFKSSRSLSLHQYHNRARCYYESHFDDYYNESSQETNAQSTFDDNDDGGNDDRDNGDDDNGNIHDDDNNDEQGNNNIPFELTEENLQDIPGETDVITHFVEQRVHVELLQLLEKAEAPDYLFKDILEWSSRAKALKYDFTPSHTTRKAVLSDLQKHLNMQSLRPDLSQLTLESVDEEVPIVTFNFKAMLISLLTDTKLMQPENLVINDDTEDEDGEIDVSPWFAPYESPDGLLDEVLSGSWYKDTISSIDDPDCFVCPLILYIDKTFIDPIKSRFNLEPFNFTLAIFNRECRMQFPFWRTLGYIPESPKCSEKTPSPGVKARNYHTMLEFVLKGILEIHANPSILDSFPLRIGNFVKKVNLRVPIAFIIADTQGADKLCGRYLVYKDNVHRLHRSCKCIPSDATDTENKCEWVDMDEMMNVIERGDKDELLNYSQHHIPLHAFRNIDFGSNRHGIYGATPNDVLHGMKLGIIKYVMEIFLEEELNVSARHHLDKALKKTLPHLKQGGNSQFPRMYFPNGICSLTNTTAEELVGIMFVTYLLCNTQLGRDALSMSDKMSIARINMYVALFEKIFIFLAWMSSKNGFWDINDTRAKRRASKKIDALVTFICENFTRESKQNWNISKMHELMHLPKLIEMFGSPMNSDAASSERMHIEIAKKTGRKTQKHHRTFTMQAATRLADRHVIDVAYKYLVEMPNEMEKSTLEPKSPPSQYGSTFVLNVTESTSASFGIDYHVSISGRGALAFAKLESVLYPDLAEFIVAYFSEFDDPMPPTIRCCTEFYDYEAECGFRAHHDYRASGFWHDWALTSYGNDSEEGFANVPSKVLCFLPDGIPGNDECHVVCHPCKWNKKRVTQLITKWQLLPCSEASINNIPYDIVPASSLFAHCLIVPDLAEDGTVYEVADKSKWAELF